MHVAADLARWRIVVVERRWWRWRHVEFVVELHRVEQFVVVGRIEFVVEHELVVERVVVEQLVDQQLVIELVEQFVLVEFVVLEQFVQQLVVVEQLVDRVVLQQLVVEQLEPILELVEFVGGVGDPTVRTSACSAADALDARQAVEAVVEAEDAGDAMFRHHRGMDRIAGRELCARQHDRLGAFHDRGIDGQDVVHDAEQDVQRRLNGVATIHRDVAVENLLQHLGVGHQAFPFRDELLQQTLTVDLVGM